MTSDKPISCYSINTFLLDRGGGSDIVLEGPYQEDWEGFCKNLIEETAVAWLKTHGPNDGECLAYKIFDDFMKALRKYGYNRISPPLKGSFLYPLTNSPLGSYGQSSEEKLSIYFSELGISTDANRELTKINKEDSE